MTLTKTLAVIDARDDELGADANVRIPPQSCRGADLRLAGRHTRHRPSIAAARR